MQVLEYNAFEASLKQMLLRLLDLVHHLIPKPFIPLDNNPLKHTIINRPIETTPISPRLAILGILVHQALYLDVEALVIDKLVHQHGEGEQVADQGRLGFDLLADHLLLLFVQEHLGLFLGLAFLGLGRGLAVWRWVVRLDRGLFLLYWLLWVHLCISVLLIEIILNHNSI